MLAVIAWTIEDGFEVIQLQIEGGGGSKAFSGLVINLGLIFSSFAKPEK